MTKIRVREAGPGDFAPLLDLLDGMDESMYGARGHASGDELRALYDSILADADQAIFVAEDNGRLAGTAHLMVLRHFVPALTRSGVVEGVVVDQDYRRAGVGAALMRAVAKAAREAGCYKLALSSNLARQGAHRFYSRLGWKRSHYGYSMEL